MFCNVSGTLPSLHSITSMTLNRMYIIVLSSRTIFSLNFSLFSLSCLTRQSTANTLFTIWQGFFYFIYDNHIRSYHLDEQFGLYDIHNVIMDSIFDSNWCLAITAVVPRRAVSVVPLSYIPRFNFDQYTKTILFISY